MLHDYGCSYMFKHAKINELFMRIQLQNYKYIKKEWFGAVNNSSVLDMYRIFKTTLEYETYLDLQPKRL